MTLNRSTMQVAEAERAPHPHLRACPPIDKTPAGPARRELIGDSVPSRPVAVDARHQNVFTTEELDLIALFADGLCIEAIARQLDLSDRTIRRRSRALCDRLGVVSTIQVVAWAARRQLI